LNHITAPKLLVPDSSENLSDDPLRDGEAIPCVMENTAAGAPAQESTHVCHPVSFSMSEITWALLGVPPLGVGLGLAPGLGEGVGPGLEEALVAEEPDAAVCPPHPASRTNMATNIKIARLGRSSFFSVCIFGELFSE
jgi:hypothetical protein